MAIVKNDGSLREERLDGVDGRESLPEIRESVSVDGFDESSSDISASSSALSADGVDSDSDTDDADSGMGSDSFDLSELSEPGTELFQVGNHSVSLPLELYNLQDLGPILNLDTWNNLLTEEERFALSEFLPDMYQETFTQTLKELFLGKNFHFGNPLCDLFTKLKAGALDPRVVIYRKGLNSFKKREHYHLLRKYQNSMVGSLGKIRDAWQDCSGYGIEERLRLLNILRSQRSLGYEEDGARSETDSGNSAEDVWGQRQPLRFGKDNTKGILKVTPPEKASARKQYPLLTKHGVEKKIKAFKGPLDFPRHYDDDNDDEDEEMEDQGYEGDARAHMLKPSKKEDLKRYGGNNEGYVGMVPYDRKGGNVDQGVTIASYNPHSLETMSRARYSGKDWMYPSKEQSEHQVPKGAQVDWSAGIQHLKSEDRNIRGNKLRNGDEFRTSISKVDFNSKVKPYKALPSHMGDQYLYSDRKDKMVQAKIKTKSANDRRIGMGFPKGSSGFSHSEETESDSSEQVEEDGDVYPYGKVGYPSGAMDGQHPGVTKSAYDLKKSSKHGKVDKKVHSSILSPEDKLYSTKVKHKSRMAEGSYLQDVVRVKKGQVLCPSEKVQALSLKASATDKKRKGAVGLDQFAEHNLLPDYDSGKMNEYLDGNTRFVDTPMQANRSGNRYQFADADADHIERPNMPLLVCNYVSKKQKGKSDNTNQDEMEEAVYLQCSPIQQIDDTNFIKKKVKRRADIAASPLSVATPDSILPEKGKADVEPEKPQKKLFALITPTKHTGFSFSIIHLLSAVRKAMATPHAEDESEIGNRLEKGDSRLKQINEENKILQAVNGTSLPNMNMDMNASSESGHNNLPSFTVQEIVNQVRTNPGDPRLLETQEPLQDLVRGLLKIFSSKTAPLGAKGWKALVAYEKSNKSWCWVGPLSSSSPDVDNVEEETSAEAWNIPHKMLVKLVDAFANWLKSGQETLRQIGSLPAPPIAMLPHLDEKERFRDLRAQKSLNTISPSFEEVRAYFRKEELLRYLIPDRAFSYTAADGKKSIVAPLRRGGGKPTSKARDHFMLKPDRPPHVTILCLVRDAAARLPGSIGTRADVCTLIRDSQYIVEDVADAQVNQVVSGALDRLHYERDPCVQFDADRKLWVYLHRDREEEDFEDDGTSSTKKWKRQRKDPTDQSDAGAAIDVSYHGTGDPAGRGSDKYDFNPDLNIDVSSMQAGRNGEPIYNDLSSNMDAFQSFIDPSAGDRGQGYSMGWEGLGLTPQRDNKILCQENSTNEDFEDEAFGRERQFGILSASLS